MPFEFGSYSRLKRLRSSGNARLFFYNFFILNRNAN